MSLFEMAKQKREAEVGPYSVAPTTAPQIGPGPEQQSSGTYSLQPEEAQLAAQAAPDVPNPPPIDANATAGIPQPGVGAAVSPLGELAQQTPSQGPDFFSEAPDAMAEAMAERRKWQAIGDLTKTLSSAGKTVATGGIGGLIG
jgi:hypothetical protein